MSLDWVYPEWNRKPIGFVSYRHDLLLAAANASGVYQGPNIQGRRGVAGERLREGCGGRLARSCSTASAVSQPGLRRSPGVRSIKTRLRLL